MTELSSAAEARLESLASNLLAIRDHRRRLTAEHFADATAILDLGGVALKAKALETDRFDAALQFVIQAVEEVSDSRWKDAGRLFLYLPKSNEVYVGSREQQYREMANLLDTSHDELKRGQGQRWFARELARVIARFNSRLVAESRRVGGPPMPDQPQSSPVLYDVQSDIYNNLFHGDLFLAFVWSLLLPWQTGRFTAGSTDNRWSLWVFAKMLDRSTYGAEWQRNDPVGLEQKRNPVLQIEGYWSDDEFFQVVCVDWTSWEVSALRSALDRKGRSEIVIFNSQLLPLLPGAFERWDDWLSLCTCRMDLDPLEHGVTYGCAVHRNIEVAGRIFSRIGVWPIRRS